MKNHLNFHNLSINYDLILKTHGLLDIYTQESMLLLNQAVMIYQIRHSIKAH